MTPEKTLNLLERRVLGVLMEKSMAQPDYYPMTLNALVAACNQKQNRDPVTSLTEEEVFQALEALRERSLVTMVFAAPGARSNRFRHEADRFYGWQPRERAVMTELLLREAQTVGELRTHCSRFYPFDNLDAVSIVLDCLTKADPPLIAMLPRESGKSAIRYTHLLYPPDEQPQPVATSAPALQSSPPVGRVEPATASPTPQITDGNSTGVRNEIDNIQMELAELQQALAEFSRRLDTLEQRIG